MISDTIRARFDKEVAKYPSDQRQSNDQLDQLIDGLKRATS